jgi:hypothetical protein
MEPHVWIVRNLVKERKVELCEKSILYKRQSSNIKKKKENTKEDK